MSLSNWSVKNIESNGLAYEIYVHNSAGTSKTGSTRELYDSFGLTDKLVKINSGSRQFLEISPIGDGIKDYYIYARRVDSDSYYYNPFISWDNWTLTTSGWNTNNLNDDLEVEIGYEVSNENDNAKIPIKWAISGDPLSWSASEKTGIVSITGAGIDGFTLNQIHNNAFVESFFNSGQYLYISGQEAKITNRSTFDLNGSTGYGNIYLTNAYIDPTGGNLIDIASQFSTLYENDSSLTVTAEEINYPLENIKLNYEFGAGSGYENGYIVSEAPSYIKTYSGSVVGPQSITGSTFGRTEFARNGYINIENATGLSSTDFCFLIDCTKKDNQPATIFSNLGAYSQSDVSGFEIGINSTNHLYFKYHQDFQPYIYTLSKAGAQRNIYYISAQDDRLQLGKFDFDKNNFDLNEFFIKPNFLRQSNHWKIGTGEYNFSGYINSLMYINPFFQGGNHVEKFAQSFNQSVFRSAALYDILPGQITGYEEYATPNTGIIGYTGALSGYVTGIYTGSQITGTGIDTTLYLKSKNGLYTSGDNFSGRYIHNVLINFDLDSSGTGFYEVSDTNQRLSSLAWWEDRKTILAIEDEDGVVSEFNRNRKLVRSITGNIHDAEGICHMSGNTFAFLEEADPLNSNSGAIYYGEITNSTTSINTGVLTKIPLAIDGTNNTGVEGITFDTGRNCFYVVKEKSPASLYKVELDGTLTNYPAFNNLMSDYSDLHYDHNTDSLYILSDEDQKIIQTSMSADTWYEKDISYISKPEGIAISSDLEKMYICSDNTGQAGAFYTANQKNTKQYGFSYQTTGFTSGEFNQNVFIYDDLYDTGINLSITTGFITGEEEFTYTGIDPVYIYSGITGYDGTTGYTYSNLTGDHISFLTRQIENKFIKNSDKYIEYLYDSIMPYGRFASGDMVEVVYPKLYPNIEYYGSGYGVSGLDISREAPDYGKLDINGRYGVNSTFGRPGFFIDINDFDGSERVYLNGVIQKPGVIKYRTNASYEQEPYIDEGDYAISGIEILGSGSGFLYINNPYNERMFIDFDQPTGTSGVVSQRAIVTSKSDYEDYVTLGISGIYNNIFLNGQKLYSGIDYIVTGDHYFFATGGTEDLTGNIYTTPKNPLLNYVTGNKPFIQNGLFNEDNFAYLNGIRAEDIQIKLFSQEASLFQGDQLIDIDCELDFVYHADFDTFVKQLEPIELNPLPDFTWSGSTKINSLYF